MDDVDPVEEVFGDTVGPRRRQLYPDKRESAERRFFQLLQDHAGADQIGRILGHLQGIFHRVLPRCVGEEVHEIIEQVGGKEIVVVDVEPGTEVDVAPVSGAGAGLVRVCDLIDDPVVAAL